MQIYQQIHATSRVKLALALSLLIVSFVLLGIAVGVAAQGLPQSEICNGKDDNGDGRVDEVNCDHYLTYLLDRVINPINVVLRDQFISSTDFQLVGIERLLNPAKKLHAGLFFGVQRPDLHYLAYRLRSFAPFTPRPVLIQNQFETRTVLATQPRYLLAPTGKKILGAPIERILSAVPPNVAEKLIATIIPPVPQDANHYLCYDVEPYDIDQNVLLRDEFQGREFNVVRAKYLCNPAEKAHNGKTYNIVDENNHLMCYEVLPHNPINRKVVAHNQFGINTFNVPRTEEVCLPTVKTLLQCSHPDVDGTAVIFDNTTAYQNASDGHLVVIPPTPAGGGLTASMMLHSGPDTVITRSGSPAGGEAYMFNTEMLQLQLSSGHTLTIMPMNGQLGTSPRTPGDPVQSFDTDMMQLQGQLPPGDPDFDLLRITAGTNFGLPSPGHTTLTQLPGGNWNIDSFFDIEYRIDFVGAPGGPYAGQSGSNVGRVRLENICSSPQ